VTGRAVVDDAGVIEHGVEKTAGDVTDAAILGGRQVIDVLADGRHAIMAGRAVVHDAGMIKHRGGKCRGAMAIGAIPGRGHMVGWFAQGD